MYFLGMRQLANILHTILDDFPEGLGTKNVQQNKVQRLQLWILIEKFAPTLIGLPIILSFMAKRSLSPVKVIIIRGFNSSITYSAVVSFSSFE